MKLFQDFHSIGHYDLLCIRVEPFGQIKEGWISECSVPFLSNSHSWELLFKDFHHVGHYALLMLLNKSENGWWNLFIAINDFTCQFAIFLCLDSLGFWHTPSSCYNLSKLSFLKKRRFFFLLERVIFLCSHSWVQTVTIFTNLHFNS